MIATLRNDMRGIRSGDLPKRGPVRRYLGTITLAANGKLPARYGRRRDLVRSRARSLIAHRRRARMCRTARQMSTTPMAEMHSEPAEIHKNIRLIGSELVRVSISPSRLPA